MITFIINLDTSQDRWEKYKETECIRWRATPRDEVDELTNKKMISHHNYPLYKHLGRCACFLSHMNLLKHIVQNKLNDVLILEDDAVKYDDIPDGYSTDGITYVGGWAHHKKMMNNEIIILKDEKGYHKKGDYRILMTMSYIVPTWEVASKILNYIMNKKRYRAVDIMYDDLPVEIYYKYPASFIEDTCPSTIDIKKSKRADHKYMVH